MSGDVDAPETVTWTRIALYGCPGMECGNVIDGEPLPETAEFYGCGKPGRWLLGRVFLCDDHSREVAEALGDDIDAIHAAWKEKVRG